MYIVGESGRGDEGNWQKKAGRSVRYHTVGYEARTSCFVSLSEVWLFWRSRDRSARPTPSVTLVPLSLTAAPRDVRPFALATAQRGSAAVINRRPKRRNEGDTEITMIKSDDAMIKDSEGAKLHQSLGRSP